MTAPPDTAVLVADVGNTRLKLAAVVAGTTPPGVL